MSIPDIINGSFELSGGIFVLNHCRAILRDKSVKGVSIISSLFFLAWGFWNLYFYPNINQWFSFVGGIGLVLSNLLWISLMFYYRNKVESEPVKKSKVEIERKFLIDTHHPKFLPLLSQYPSTSITQGFLSYEPVVRIRATKQERETAGFITVKGKGLVSRAEFEYPIPYEDALALLKLCQKTMIKHRSAVYYRDKQEYKLWEIDGFEDGNWLAEIELPDVNEKFELPPWVTTEVTDDKRYANVNIIRDGFPV